MTTLRTQGNLPYPDGAEPVKQGDNAIGALAAAVDMVWKPLTMGAGWSGVAAGMPAPRIRNGAGQLSYSGFAFYTGAFTAGTGITICNSSAAVVEAAYANAGNYFIIPIGLMSGSTLIPGYLRILTDGRSIVVPAASGTNLVACLEGVRVASPCLVAP